MPGTYSTVGSGLNKQSMIPFTWKQQATRCLHTLVILTEFIVHNSTIIFYYLVLANLKIRYNLSLNFFTFYIHPNL